MDFIDTRARFLTYYALCLLLLYGHIYFVIKFPEGEVFSVIGGPGLGADTDLQSGYIMGSLFSVDGQPFQEINIFNLAVDVFIGDESQMLFRVERSTGDIFTKGSFIAGGADLAECINVSEQVESGDVVELDPENPGHYRKARESSKLIAGVITTEPGFILENNSKLSILSKNKSNENNLRAGGGGKSRLTLMGRVPVKVTTENGAIRLGDLLMVSSKPGCAMRLIPGMENNETCIGKALESLQNGEGLILALVIGHL